MIIQHSSQDDSWMTPLWLIDRVIGILGSIELDPASSEKANQRVRADYYYDESDNGLVQEWAGNVFCNPPGGKIGNKSKTKLFWQKLMIERPNIEHAIFLFFSAEGLQNTQSPDYPAACDFPVCIPAKRIRFDGPDGLPGKAPSHSNAIVYVPGFKDRSNVFANVFANTGKIMRPW